MDPHLPGRVLLQGLTTFKRGYIWRVGPGHKINIWNSPWIPGSASRKILTPRGNILLKTVDELIDPETHCWDEQLIRDIFNPIDVSRILCIPLNENMT